MTALVVEDGTPVAGSNTYVDVGNVDTYLSDYGKASAKWSAASASEKGAAVLRAAQIMRARYGGQWLGERTERSQPMQWPRKDLIDFDGYEYDNHTIPPEVQHCQIEIAILVIAGESVVNDKVQKASHVQSEKVGPISTTFFPNAPSIDLFPWIDQLVGEFAIAGSNKTGMSIGLTARERDQANDEFDPFGYGEYFHLSKGY